jgi:hypothetical protein
MPAQSPFTKMRPKSQPTRIFWDGENQRQTQPSSGREIISASWRGPQRWDKGNMEAIKYTLTSHRTSEEVSQTSPHINSFQWVGPLSWQISNIISNGTKLKIVITIQSDCQATSIFLILLLLNPCFFRTEHWTWCPYMKALFL